MRDLWADDFRDRYNFIKDYHRREIICLAWIPGTSIVMYPHINISSFIAKKTSDSINRNILHSTNRTKCSMILVRMDWATQMQEKYGLNVGNSPFIPTNSTWIEASFDLGTQLKNLYLS